MKRVHVSCAVVLVLALPLVADGATRHVSDTGVDGPNCGTTLATACRSITAAIALAVPGDIISVGPGRYGDLNMNGTLGDFPGEETGSPGCSCVLSMNKNVVIMSTKGAATTLIDGTTVNVVQTVVVLSNGGEFGRPGKGFTVTQTGRFDSSQEKFTGHGIGIDAANVKVRGNQVLFAAVFGTTGIGIFTVNNAANIIEGNRVSNWSIGIDVRVAGATTVSKNEVIGSGIVGIDAAGGKVVGNVVTGNSTGMFLRGTTTVTGNAAYKNLGFGFLVRPGFSGTFSKNNMYSNAPIGLQGCGLYNQDIVGFDATNNYWGTANGPGAPPADQACVFHVGTTTTSPFATEPFKITILKP